MSEHPIRYVRRTVFKATQQELASLGGVSRPRVSRYESGEEPPPYGFLAKLRLAALEQGLPWNTDWLFATPAPESVAGADAIHIRAREDVQ